MAKTNKTEVRISSQGRMVIPSHIREELDIAPGELLHISVVDGALLLEKHEKFVKRLQGRFSTIPDDVSPFDELASDSQKEDSE